MFPLTISKIDGALFQGEVTSVTCPGTEGEMTILRDHIPLMAQLKKGTVTVKIHNETQTFPINSGFLSVDREGSTILL